MQKRLPVRRGGMTTVRPIVLPVQLPSAWVQWQVYAEDRKDKGERKERKEKGEGEGKGKGKGKGMGRGNFRVRVRVRRRLG